jgi:NADH dehydrogenase
VLRIVVVGGGPTGVEMAGGLQELIHRVLRKDFPELDVEGVPITLVEAAPRVLGPFHPTLSARAAAALSARGVEVLTGVGVDHVTADEVVLADGRRLGATIVVWAAGVSAHPPAGALGVEPGRGGRIPVTANLSLPGHPQVFAIGDIAIPVEGPPLPQVAQPAIQGGYHAAREILAPLAGRPPTPFRYKDKGSMATIGRNQAVVEFPNGWRFHGRLGWLMWLGCTSSTSSASATGSPHWSTGRGTTSPTTAARAPSSPTPAGRPSGGSRRGRSHPGALGWYVPSDQLDVAERTARRLRRRGRDRCRG